MRVEKWDLLMYRLLQEKKEKEVKAAKKQGSKPDFLDLDGDGDKTEPMSKAAKEAGNKNDRPKAKKGKGKIPPQLRMYINKKKAKKSKLDEAIERLEKVLFEGVEENFAPYSNQIFEADEDFEEDDQELCPICEKPEEECECNPDSEGDDSDLESHNYGAGYADTGLGEPEREDEEEEQEKSPLEEVEYLSESEVKKKKPRLGKVTRNPAGSNKKFHVYVKCNGRVKKISFGDPGLSIKRDSAARRKNFRARHKCDKPAGKNRCTARYWSCYQWRAGKKVEGE